MNIKKLRLFVAMPGTSMGNTADWTDPDKIKSHFYKKIAEALESATGKTVDLVIEKDKVLGGPIHASMLKEAMESDVYISDLTGNNPNVYLELGARWALRDAVTVVVSQNVSEILFNAAASRAIPYSKEPDKLEQSVEKTVKAILEGLEKSNYCDSPIRQNADLLAYERSFVSQLEQEIGQLKSQRGEDLFSAAKAASTPDERLRLLIEATNANPNRSDILLELGIEYRKQSKYPESQGALKKAVLLEPKRSVLHRELDVTYGKIGDLDLAVESLEEAVRLDPNDPEALRNLGGALRRSGMKSAPSSIDWALLERSRESYAKAGEVEPYDTYALLNVAKLELLLSKNDPSRQQIAAKKFEDLKPLCQFNVSQEPNDPWKRFDLADAHLFSGDIANAKQLYKEAIASIPNKHCQSYLTSVAGPLKELIEIDVVTGKLKTGLGGILTMIDKEVQSGKFG
jgi:tetratricopeptide (TPR) repeat protein